MLESEEQWPSPAAYVRSLRSRDLVARGPAWPSQREAWVWQNVRASEDVPSSGSASAEEEEEEEEEEAQSSEEESPCAGGGNEAPRVVMTPKDRLRERRLHRKAEEEAFAAQQELQGRELLHRRLFRMGEANDWAAALDLK